MPSDPQHQSTRRLTPFARGWIEGTGFGYAVATVAFCVVGWYGWAGFSAVSAAVCYGITQRLDA